MPDVPRMTGGHDLIVAYPMVANDRIQEGCLVALNSTGFAREYVQAAEGGVNAARIIGRAEEAADSTGLAQGAISVRTRTGVFRYRAHAGDEPTHREIGRVVWAVTPETVGKSDRSGGSQPNRSRAGICIDVDEEGVWVAVGLVYTQGDPR